MWQHEGSHFIHSPPPYARGSPVPDPLLFRIPSNLESSRLVLRAFTKDYAVALHEALSEAIDELRRHLWFLPWISQDQTLESATVRCRTAQANFLLRADLPYLAFRQDTGRLEGSIGLHRTDWKVPSTEVGYWLRTSEYGRGFASEGVTLLVGWALAELSVTRVEMNTLKITSHHEPSLSAAALSWRVFTVMSLSASAVS